jgi:predicted ArsR family transcriptional regulator
MANFPGQEDELVFTLEHVKTLASAIRSEVFFCFTAFDPTSVADIARGLGKSAQTIHYHVNELVAAGLLIAVGERTKRSRTEKLYVHRAVLNFTGHPAHVDAEYRSEMAKGFNAITRSLARERAFAVQAVATDPELAVFLAYRQRLVRVSNAEKAQALRQHLHRCLEELESFHEPEGQYLIHCGIYQAPTISTSREAARNAKLSKAKKKAR